MISVRAMVVSGCAAAGLVAAAQAGPPNREQIHRTPADNANARAAILKHADLGTAVSWSGGAKKPDLSPSPPCAGFSPKQSDLVLTGAAESEFSHGALDFDSEAQILQTAEMVKLDWQRSVTPKTLPCLRSIAKKSFGAKFVSMIHLAFPHVATYTRAYRLAVDQPVQGKKTRFYVDAVLYGRGRTELNLATTYPAAAAKSVLPAEVRIAKLLAARIKG